MKVYLNKITGIEDALESMLMSKRSWTKAKSDKIHELIFYATDVFTGSCADLMSEDSKDIEREMTAKMEKLIHYGVDCGHTTLLRFIDLSFTVEGLHRAAQDDFDSHAKRLDNRIIRASTRLGSFSDKASAKSEYYKDKILFPFELDKYVFPDKLFDPNVGKWFVRTDFGYIREDLQDNQDVKRGLYPLSIPSTFIFKVQYPELCHIVQLRDKNSHAHPELQQMIEIIKTEVTKANPWLGKNLTKLKMEL